MIKKANLWSTSQPTISLVHQPDSDRWLYDEVTDFTTITPQWTIYGGQIHIRPALALADAVRYFYLSNIIVSGSKTVFTADEYRIVDCAKPANQWPFFDPVIGDKGAASDS